MKDFSEIDPNFKIETQLKESDIKFYNVNQDPFRVYGVYYEDGKFKRLPQQVAVSVSEGVGALYANTTGGRVRFTTDSPYVAIHADMSAMLKRSHFALTGTAGFDLYFYDGTEKYIHTFVPPYESETGFEGIVRFPSARMREITIHFPLYSEVNELHIGLQETASITPGRLYVNDKPIVYYGSSITQGGCASRPGLSYQNILSRRLNADHVNLGFSGNARGEETIADYISTLEMAAFVMDYDHNAASAEHLQKTHERMFRKVRDAHPDLPIIIMTRPKYYPTPGEEKRAEVMKATYLNALHNGDQNVYFIDSRTLMSLSGDEGTVDGCHPNDLGFMSMAVALEPVLKKLL